MASILKTRLDRFFQLSERKSSVGKEFRAGTTTFLTMSYILFVNPQILGQAIQLDGVNLVPQLVAATALAAAFGSLCMGLLSNGPFALAPGMGLNAYFAFSVVLGQGVPWQSALGAVFISGILFLIISIVGAREAILKAIPLELKYATTAGIGCFLAMIGMVNGGLVVDHPVTLVTLGPTTSPGILLALSGLVLTLVLLVRQVKGAILWGILATSAAAIFLNLPVFNGAVFSGFQDGLLRAPAWPEDLFFAMDLKGAMGMGILTVVFTFLFVDFFDSAGTLIALSEKAGMMNEDGELGQARAAFSADATATVVGAVLGTSSTTAYVESASGIEDGGKTGLTAVTVAILFLGCLFLWPLVGAVPSAATAPALVIIGAMMMFTVTKIGWDDYKQSVPALVTILGMPATYSITNGIGLGLITYCLVHLLSGHYRKIHWLMVVLTVLLILRFGFLAD